MQKRLAEQGLRYLEEGQLEKAGQVLSHLIISFPENAEAHHMLGIIELERGNLEAAYILVNTAIDIDETNSLFYNTMGNVELHRKNIGAAETAFLKAVKYELEKIEYKYNLANFYLTQNQYAKAVDYYYYVLHSNPTHYLSIRGITVCYLFSGEIDIALEHANDWVKEFSDYDEPYYYLGLCLYAMHDITGALAAYDLGLNICPTNYEIISAIGACYLALGNISIAETYIYKALGLEARNPVAIYNLACLYLDKGDTDTARDLFLNAINLDDMYAAPLCGLGNIELSKGREDLALEYFMNAQKIEPLGVLPKLLTATTLLKQMNFTAGWTAYKNVLSPLPLLSQLPEWAGNELSNSEVLLVWVPRENLDLAQQIMFLSMLPDLLLRVQHVILMCDQRLMPLAQKSFPRCTIVANISMHEIETNKHKITQQIAISALGQHLRLNLTSFFNTTTQKYLTAEPERVEYFKKKYKQLFAGKKLIGIAWKSATNLKIIDHTKSTHLSAWLKFLKKSNFQFISLQSGDVTTELKQVNDSMRKDVYVDPEIVLTGKANLLDLSAQMSALDMVVTVDNFVAHLAGALSIPTCTLLPLKSEWYWFKNQEYSLWYPAMTMLQQQKANAWAKPINDLIKRV